MKWAMHSNRAWAASETSNTSTEGAKSVVGHFKLIHRPHVAQNSCWLVGQHCFRLCKNDKNKFDGYYVQFSHYCIDWCLAMMISRNYIYQWKCTEVNKFEAAFHKWSVSWWNVITWILITQGMPIQHHNVFENCTNASTDTSWHCEVQKSTIKIAYLMTDHPILNNDSIA